MDNTDLNDFIVEISCDMDEINSITKVLRDSVFNENRSISMKDVGNSLEVLITKISNTKNSLEKYIDYTFTP